MSGLEQMLNELESNRLEVILIPEKRRTHDMGMVRCAVSKNAKWYRDFCGRFASSRKRRNAAFDTCIKRHRTIAALQDMIAGRRSTYYFAELSRISRTFK